MIFTFHKTLQGCEEGSPTAWQTFLARYTAIAFQLFQVYLPWTEDHRLEFWREMVKELAAGDCEQLRKFSHQSEREFLIDLRGFLLDQLTLKLERSLDISEPPAPTTGSLAALLKDLPLLHREIIFLALAGYSQATLEKVLRISPAVSQQSMERLRAGYARVLERSGDRCLWPAGWLEITRSARAGKSDGCTELRQLIRILDGQASWYDKRPVEEHRGNCLRCLELWTALLEVVAWEREAKPWAPAMIEPLLTTIPLPGGAKSVKSFFARMFGK